MTYDFTGKTEKEAIEMAAMQLGLEQDKFDVEILETQKTSLFKKGHVKIRVHVDGDIDLAKVDEEAYNKVQRAAPPAENYRASQPEKYRSGSARSPRSETSSRNSAIPGDTPAVAADPAPQNEFETKLIDFVNTVVSKMGYESTAEFVVREEHKLVIKLNSSNSNILIGRKGKNLDALQMLVNVYADRLEHGDVRVILDTENYRIRHEESLVRLAYATADKVRSRGGSVLLEPMNPFERRIIHTALNDSDDVETKSEGDGLYKQVRVFAKGAHGRR
jgi:spoIIIJ-associated protein